MYELKKIGKVLGPGPRLVKKRINWAAVSQRLRNTAVDEYDVCSLYAGHLELQIHTQNMYCLLFFFCNDGCTNASQCYAIPRLHVLFFLVSADELGLSKFVHFIRLEDFMMIRVIKCSWANSLVIPHISYPTYIV